MTRDICTTVSIIYFLLTLTLSRGSAQANMFNAIITRASLTLITPSSVRFTCITANLSAQFVTWIDPNGVQLNSTTVTRLSDQESDPSVVATLDVERETCHSGHYTCVFENELASFETEVECPPIPEVHFESSVYTVSESERSLQVCVKVYNATSESRVTITETDHTASRRTDFTLPQTFDLIITREQLVAVTVESCSSSTLCGRLCFNIPITQDTVFEYELEFFSLEARAGDILSQSISETTVYIQDDDDLVIGFDRATLTVHEEDHQCSPSFRVCAQISDVILGVPLLMMPVWKAGTATEGIDYYHPPCNFTIPTGGYMDCMDLTVVNDNVAELTETLSVVVGQVFVDGQEVMVGDRVRTDVRETVIEIIDDDVFEISFEELEYTIQEGGPGEIHIDLRACLVQREDGAQSVELEGGKNFLSVDLKINTHDGTAIAGSDFEMVNTTTTLSLPLLPTSPEGRCVCVGILRDRVVESMEYFDINLHSLSSFVKTAGSRVLVRDNSMSDVSVGFESSEYTVSEKEGSLEVCVSLSGDYQRSINVYVCTEPGTATDNVDFVRIESHRLIFPTNPFSAPISGGKVCFSVTVLEDRLLEEEERFSLTLRSSDNAVQLTLSTTSVVILNDGGSLPSLTYVDNTPSVNGNTISADFNVTNHQEVSSIFCELIGPGRTPTTILNCSSGHVTFTNLPLRRQKFTLSVNAHLYSQPLRPLLLSTVDLRLDHDVCWLHPINEGVVRDGESVIFEWQATGPSTDLRVAKFLCRRDRERTQVPCVSPYVWSTPSPGSHTLSVTPTLTSGCRRHITRSFDFTYE